MFKVKARYKESTEFTVFAINKEQYRTWFLFWDKDSWFWDDASNYIPII